MALNFLYVVPHAAPVGGVGLPLLAFHRAQDPILVDELVQPAVGVSVAADAGLHQDPRPAARHIPARTDVRRDQ